jgi:hypothetical protein
MQLTGELILDRSFIDEMAWEPFGAAHDVHEKTLWRDRGSTAGLLWLEAGASIDIHTHRIATHHLWMVHGSCMSGGRELHARSYVAVPPGVPHGISSAGPDGCVLFYLFLTES